MIGQIAPYILVEQRLRDPNRCRWIGMREGGGAVETGIGRG